MKRLTFIILLFVAFRLDAQNVAQTPYYCDFEDSASAAGWVLTNGTQSSQWCIGSAVNDTPDGAKCLYISADSGATHSYGSTESHVFASRTLHLDSGEYLINYDWRCKMPATYTNRLRAALVPGAATFTAGDNGGWWFYGVPDGYIRIDSLNGFNGIADWTSYRQRVHIDSTGTYTLAFVFNCNGYYLSSMWTAPAIDNISVELVTCPMADSLTAVASADSVWLNWNEADTAMRWLVRWNGHTVAVDTSFAAIGGLDMGKKYDFYVSPICGSDTGFYELLSIVMPCDSLRRLPYFLHFDDIYVDPYTEYNRMPDCWTRLCTNTAPNNLGLSPALNSYGTYGVGGTTGLYWILASYLPSQYAVLPPVAEALGPMDSLVVTFEAKKITYPWSKLVVGVMTDPNDSTTFVAVDSVNIQGSSFTEYSVPLTGYTGTGRCVALHIKEGSTMGSNMAFTMAMDNIGLSKISDCTPPVSVVKHPYPDHIDLSWTPGSGAVYWEVTCNGVTEQVTNTVHTISNLQPETDYFVDIVSSCSYGEQSLPRHFKVTTKCLPPELPYSYDFSGDEFDKCWYKSSSYPELSNGTLRFEPLWSRYSYAVLPIYPASVTPLEFSFSLKQDTIQVGVVDDPYDISSFVPIRTILKSRNGIWERYYCYFNGYTGTGRYLAFRSPSTGYAGYINDAFVDSVEVKVAPSCPTPDTYRLVSRGHNSVTISWYGQGRSLFRIDYAPEGGTTTTLYSQNDTLTLTGLQPSTDYTVSIRIVCGDGDTSIALTGAFHTFAPPATVPYSCGFDSSCSDGWTLFNGNNINRWCVGQAAYNDTSDHRGLYISDDDGVTSQCTFTSTSLVMAVRNFSLQAGNYNYSYDYRRTGSAGDNEYFGAALLPDSILLKDGTDFARTWYSNHIPAGGIQLQDYVQYILTPDGSWNTCSGQIAVPSSGNWNLVFFWRNSNNSGINPPAAVDNVFLDINSCPSVSDLTYSTVTHNAVTLDWAENGTATSWDVEYGPHGFTPGTGTFHTFFTHPCTLPFLQPSTTYDIYVKPVCADSQFVFYTGPVTISTEVCAQPDIVEFSDSSYNDNLQYAPVFVFNPYSVSVTILDSATLGGPKDYEGLRFFYTGEMPLTAKDDIDIYLQPTQLEYFSYNYSGPLFDSLTARHVYSGPFNFSYGWNNVAFDSVYPYLGVGNVLMFIVDNSGSSQGDATFRGYYGYYSSCVSISFYGDQPFSLSNLTYSNDHWNNYTLPFLQLYSCTPYCAPVAGLSVDTVGYNFASVSWSGDAQAYEVTLRLLDADGQDVVSTVNANHIDLTGLVPTSRYRCSVRSVCDSVEGLFSQPTAIEIVTDTLLCDAPTGLTVSDIDYTSAVFDWQPVTEEGQWILHIWNTAYDTNVFVTGHPALFEGLAQGVSYNAAVRALCGGIVESDNSNTVQFSTLTCPPVENLQVGNVTQTSAFVSWSTSAATCDIEYGPRGFGSGQGTRISNISDGNVTISDLNTDTYYDINVKANCGNGVSSRWSTVTFKTDASGITTGEAARVTISPNPASHNATVTIGGISGHIDVSVYDLGGRVVLSQSLDCGGDCQATLDIEGLPQGPYFVKIAKGELNIVQKLVIQ